MWYRWRHQNTTMERCYTKSDSVKTQQIGSHFGLWIGENSGREVTWFSKSSHFKMFPVHRKTKSRCTCLQIPLVCRVFSKNSISWPIILLWTVGIAVEKSYCWRGFNIQRQSVLGVVFWVFGSTIVQTTLRFFVLAHEQNSIRRCSILDSCRLFLIYHVLANTENFIAHLKFSCVNLYFLALMRIRY